MVAGRLWLVGLGFRTPWGRLVRHFYVVDGMAGPEQAHEAALEPANDPSERAAHGTCGSMRAVSRCVECRVTFWAPDGCPSQVRALRSPLNP